MLNVMTVGVASLLFADSICPSSRGPTVTSKHALTHLTFAFKVQAAVLTWQPMVWPCHTSQVSKLYSSVKNDVLLVANAHFSDIH